jgi:signal peptidase II
MKHPLLLALPCYALDQATKGWIVSHYEMGSEHPVVRGFFTLTYSANTGAAFSMLTGKSWLFVILSAVTLAGLLVAWARGSFRDRLNWWGVGLLMGGILGNLTDRLVHHFVVDFLSFDLHIPYADPFATFNVADSCICIAVGLFLVASFREDRLRRVV